MAAGLSVTVTSMPRILVVDDTPALLDVIRRCLESEGYFVRTCLESRNAVQMAREDRPDVAECRAAGIEVADDDVRLVAAHGTWVWPFGFAMCGGDGRGDLGGCVQLDVDTT